MKLKALVAMMVMGVIAVPTGGAYANGTVKLTIEPKVFNVTYTPGKGISGNAEFTPSVWHEDQPSGLFAECDRASHVSVRVQKLFYPFKFPSSPSEWTNPNWADYQDSFAYHIGSLEKKYGTYTGLCIFSPEAMKMYDYSKSYRPVPNTVITADEAASFCSKPENQGRRHGIKKLVYAKVSHANYKVNDHLAFDIADINLACDCSPLYLKDAGNNVIYRTDNQKVKRTLLTLGSSSMVLPLKTSVSSGQLPPGLDMKLSPDSKELYLEGVPETEGIFKFSVKIKDACPLEREETVDFNISVLCGTMKFKTPQKLPDALLKKPYTAAIETTCNASYSNVRYELLGELPAGLTLSPSGKISGTPTEEKETYFYISATGRENGASKEIHQRFDLMVMREIQVVPGVIKPGANGDPTDALMNAPEITGVPQTCRPGETLTVSYRGLKPQFGAKMGLFGEKEAGSNPALGWKTVGGASGTLSFTASSKPGRYLFKIYDKSGKVLMKSPVFTAVQTLVPDVPAGTTAEPAVAAEVAGPRVSTGVRTASGLQGRMPSVNCADTLPVKGMEGYTIANCVKRFDEARLLIDPDPEAPKNPRYEGEKTTVVYEWAGDGVSPSVTQVKRHFSKETGRLGSKVLGERQNFGAYELSRSGNKAYLSIDVYNDGRTVHVMMIEPETVEP